MTTDSRFKKKVRERMAQTGESYMTARTKLLASRPEEKPPTDEEIDARAAKKANAVIEKLNGVK